MNIGFYVSIVRGENWRPLAGPYRSEAEARQKIDHFRKAACDLDAKCCFDFFGTCKVEQQEHLPFGIFTPNQAKLC